MYPKKYLIITLASTIILGLIYRYYKKKNHKNLEYKKNDYNEIILQNDNEEIDLSSDSDDVISEYSNDSIDSDYYPNWNNLLNDLIKSGNQVYDSHICKIDKKNYQPVLDLRNHNNRFWIKK